MIHYITKPKNELESSLLEQMFRQRAEAFLERREWSVEVKDGREYDQFDDMDPLYVIVATDAGELQASIRLLPTAGPHMLADVFPEVMGEGEFVRNPLVWELSRFSVVKSDVTISKNGVNLVTYQLLDAAFDIAYKSGISHLVSVYDVFVQRILRRAGYAFEQLGPVVQYDRGLKTIAGMANVEENMISVQSRQGASKTIQETSNL
jgi:N-acyl-L-homoserine lactone synthetase